MRRGLTALIDSEPDLVVTAEAGNRHAALEAIAQRPPDIAIVDLSLEGGEDGLDLVKALKLGSPPVAALVLSMHPEAIYAERALRAGARGYLGKQQLGEAVLTAIRRVLAGRIYMSEALGMELASQFVGGDTEAPVVACGAQRPRVAGVPSDRGGAAHAGDRADPQSEPEDDRILSRTLEAEAGHRRGRPSWSGAPSASSKPARSTDRICARAWCLFQKSWTSPEAPIAKAKGLEG